MVLQLFISQLSLLGLTLVTRVLSQSLTFIATCNAISYAGAKPVFIDVDVDTMGLSPKALKYFLENNAKKTMNGTFNKTSGRKISACVPMHTFGFPCRIVEIAEICADWNIALIEDAAESLGSYVAIVIQVLLLQWARSASMEIRSLPRVVEA